jgi:hypothetical protein
VVKNPIRKVELFVLCNSAIKSREKVKVETAIEFSKKCSTSNAMDYTGVALLWDTDEEVETDLTEAEWDPYDNAVNSESHDELDELFASDED